VAPGEEEQQKAAPPPPPRPPPLPPRPPPPLTGAQSSLHVRLLALPPAPLFVSAPPFVSLGLTQSKHVGELRFHTSFPRAVPRCSAVLGFQGASPAASSTRSQLASMEATHAPPLWSFQANGSDGRSLLLFLQAPDGRRWFLSQVAGAVAPASFDLSCSIEHAAVFVAECTASLADDRSFVLRVVTDFDAESFEWLDTCGRSALPVTPPSVYLGWHPIKQRLLTVPLQLSAFPEDILQHFRLATSSSLDTSPTVGLLPRGVSRLVPVTAGAERLSVQHSSVLSLSRDAVVRAASSVSTGSDLAYGSRVRPSFLMFCVVDDSGPATSVRLCARLPVSDNDAEVRALSVVSTAGSYLPTFQFQLSRSDLRLAFNHIGRRWCWLPANDGAVSLSRPLASHCRQFQLIAPATAQTLNPDAIFPIADINGPVNDDHVNLFTGEVNFSFPLATIEGYSVSYPLRLMYNSHSAYMYTPPLSATVPDGNHVGGYGWKLMDYPKIVQLQYSQTTYFLDGTRKSLLTGSRGIFRAQGIYHAWLFTFDTDQQLWSIATDTGIVYTLGTATNWLLGSDQVWNLQSMMNRLTADTLSFIYATTVGMPLLSITHAATQRQLLCGFDSLGRLTLVQRKDSTRASSHILSSVALGYPSTSSALATVTVSQGSLDWTLATPTTTLASNTPAYRFQYISANDPVLYKLALSSVQVPGGALVKYQYYTGSKLIDPLTGARAPGVYPVMCASRVLEPVADQDQEGACRSIYYSFDSWAWDMDPTFNVETYAQFNVTKEFPGSPFEQASFEQLPGIGTADAPFGHVTNYFFTGQTRPRLPELQRCLPLQASSINTSWLARGVRYRRDTVQQTAQRILTVFEQPVVITGSAQQVLPHSFVMVTGASFMCSGLGNILVNWFDSNGTLVGTLLEFIHAPDSAAPQQVNWKAPRVSTVATMQVAALDGVLQLGLLQLATFPFHSLHALCRWTSARAGLDICGVRVYYSSSVSATLHVHFDVTGQEESSIFAVPVVPGSNIHSTLLFADSNTLPFTGRLDYWDDVPAVTVHGVQLLCVGSTQTGTFYGNVASGSVSIPINPSSPVCALSVRTTVQNSGVGPLQFSFDGGSNWPFSVEVSSIVPTSEFCDLRSSVPQTANVSNVLVRSATSVVTFVDITIFRPISSDAFAPTAAFVETADVLDDSLCDVQESELATFQLTPDGADTPAFLQTATSSIFKDNVWTTTNMKYNTTSTSPLYGSLVSSTTTGSHPGSTNIGRRLSTRTDIMYAAEQYGQLLTANVLLPVLQTSTYSSDPSLQQATWQLTESKTQLWSSAWPNLSNLLLPWKSVVLRNLQASPTSGYIDGDCTPDWVPLQIITARDTTSTSIVSSYAHNPYQTHGVRFDEKTHTHPVVTTLCGSLTSTIECGYLGFEWYEGADSTFPNWTLQGGAVVSFGPATSTPNPVTANTGAACYGNQAGTSVCSANSISFKAGVAYQISAWVFFAANDSSTATVGLFDGSVWSNEQSLTQGPNIVPNRWYFLQTIVPSSSTLSGKAPRVSIQNGWFDDISFSPIDAGLRAIVYDDLYRPIQTVTDRGEISIQSFDFYGNVLFKAELDHTPSARLSRLSYRYFKNPVLTQSVASRWANSMFNGIDDYKASNPNAVMSLTSGSTALVWEDYYSGATVAPSRGLQPPFVRSSHQLTTPSVGFSEAIAAIQFCAFPDSGTFAIFTEICPTTAPLVSPIGVYIEAYQFAFHSVRALYNSNGGSGALFSIEIGGTVAASCVLPAVLTSPFKMMLRVFEWHKLQLFIDGRSILVTDWNPPSVSGDAPPPPYTECGMVSRWMGAGFRCFGVFSDPEISTHFTNGGADHLQSQLPPASNTAAAFDTQVTQSLYDPRFNSQVGSVRLTSLAGATDADMQYRSTFSIPTERDPRQQESWSGSSEAWSTMTDPSRPNADSRSLEAGPAMRSAVTGTGGPFTGELGESTAMVQRSAYVDTHGWYSFFNSTTAQSPVPAELFTRIMSMQTGGDDSVAVFQSHAHDLRNSFGQAVGSIQWDMKGNSFPLHTFIERDSLQRLGKTFYPKAFSWDNSLLWPYLPPSSAFTSSATYGDRVYASSSGSRPDDFLTTGVQDSDSGASRFNYDNYQRLRIAQDPMAQTAGAQHVIYTKYDNNDRVVEQGSVVCSNGQDPWPQCNVLSQLDAPAWPQPSAPFVPTVLRSFTYDSDGTTGSSAGRNFGRLVRVDTPDVRISQAFDDFGSVGAIVTTATSGSSIPGLDSSSVVYSYDAQRRPIRVDLTVGGHSYPAVMYQYAPDGRVSGITSLGASAQYSYSNATPLTETLGGGVLTGTYRTNDAGAVNQLQWRDSSDGLVMCEELSYAEPRPAASVIQHVGQLQRVTTFWSSPNSGFWSTPPPSEAYSYSYDGFGRMTAATHFACTARNSSTSILSSNVTFSSAAAVAIPMPSPAPSSVVFLRCAFAAQSFASVFTMTFGSGVSAVTYTLSMPISVTPVYLHVALDRSLPIDFSSTGVTIKSDTSGLSILTAVWVSSIDPSNSFSNIAYDANSNISAYTITGNQTTQLSYSSSNNQCTSTSVGASGAEFDANGNIRTYATSAAASLTNMQYDKLNGRLSSLQLNGAAAVRTWYDGFDRKIFEQRPEGTTQYVFGVGADPLLEIFTSSAIPLVKRYTLYIYGPSGMVCFFQSTDYTNLGVPHYVIKDHLQSTRAIVNGGNGAIEAFFNYRPFGASLAGSGWTDEGNGSIDVKYRFTAREWQSSLGLYYFKARMYDPTMFRFLSQDPKHQFASPYIYSPDPVCQKDSTGAFFWIPVIVGVVGVMWWADQTLSVEAKLGPVRKKASSRIPTRQRWILEDRFLDSDKDIAAGRGMTIDQFYDRKNYRVLEKSTHGAGGIKAHLFGDKKKQMSVLTGEYIFVWNENGEILIADQGNAATRTLHSQLGRGAAVAAAGALEIKNGRVVSINNLSGHYKPGKVLPGEKIHPTSVHYLESVRDRLVKLGIDAKGARTDYFTI